MAMRLPVFVSGGCGRDPAFLEAAIGDGALDRLDGHRHVVDVERARGFARRRTYAAGHLGEVVGRVKVLRRLLPVGVEDEVVPVGDLIVDRAAGVTIGDAAVHAAGCLDLRVFLAQGLDEFAPMLQALRDRRVLALGALEFEEACNLAHSSSLSAVRKPAGSDTVAPANISWRGEVLQALAILRPISIFSRPSLSAACASAILISALRYSTGMTFLNFGM